MDNPILRINGPLRKSDDYDPLLEAVTFAMRQSGYTPQNRKRAAGWSLSKRKGLVLYWHNPGKDTVDGAEYHSFGQLPGDAPDKGFEPADVTLAIRNWLCSDSAKEVELDDGCEDIDHDGHNTAGFLIYTENWGKIGNADYSFFAVKPCFLWMGK